MESSHPTRVLIIAHRTAATPELLEAVRERSAQSPTRFTLLVPRASHGLHRVVDPEDHHPGEAQAVLDRALPLLADAAGAPVEGRIGDPAPLTALEDALNEQGYDEILISTLPTRLSRWLKLDLPSKAEGFGLPVHTLTASEPAEGAPTSP